MSAALSLVPDEDVVAARAWFGEFFADLDSGRIRLAGHGPDGREEYGVRQGEADLRGATREQMLDAVADAVVAEAAKGRDLFACPYAHDGPRRKGQAVSRRHVHADIDGPLDLAKVRFVGGMAVASGSVSASGEPHAHVYARLSEEVTPEVHSALCEALGDFVGGEYRDPSKVLDNDLLRPAGTRNHKGETPAEVRWLIWPDDEGVKTWKPKALARLLGRGWPIKEAEEQVQPRGEVVITGSIARRLAGLARSVTDAPRGEGNDRLNKNAYLAGAICAAATDPPPAEQVRADLVAAYMARPVPHDESVEKREREARRTALSGWEAGTKDPGAALAERPDDDVRTKTTMTESTETRLLEVAPGVAVDAEAEEWFWTAQPSLRTIREHAQARRAAPWATLGVVLSRVLAATDRGVVLPPLVGGDGSLNLFCALVGATSGGKGAAGNAGRDVLTLIAGDGVGDTFDTVQPGSGEGIAHLFARRVKQRGEPSRVERHAWSVLLDARESESMSAILQRNGGGTLAAELCKSWMGENLGHATADPTRFVPVQAHTYRLAFLMGVQPELAGWLTALTAGGLPGRFLWLPTVDAQRPARDARPSVPVPLQWHVPNGGRRVLDVPEAVVDAVEDHAEAQAEGRVDDIDGHRVFLREKVAAALTLLEDPEAVAVTPEAWDLAGHVLDVSDATRSWLLSTLAAKRATENENWGRAQGVRQDVAEETANSRATRRIATRLLNYAKAEPEGMVRSKLRGRISGKDRPYFDDAIDLLVSEGKVRVSERPGQGRPAEVVTAL